MPGHRALIHPPGAKKSEVAYAGLAILGSNKRAVGQGDDEEQLPHPWIVSEKQTSQNGKWGLSETPGSQALRPPGYDKRSSHTPAATGY